MSPSPKQRGGRGLDYAKSAANVQPLDENGNPLPPAGPAGNPYQAPGGASNWSPVGFQNTNDPRALAANQRALDWGRGDVLNQQNQNQADYANQVAQGYRSQADPTETAWALGQGGGYNPDEVNSMYLTSGEQSAIAGNPYQHYDPNGLMSGATAIRNQGYQAQNQLYSAADNPALNYDTGTNARSQGILDQTGKQVNSALDPNSLLQSQSANQREQMSPQQQQDIVTNAGISAGRGYQANVGAAQRAEAAAGMDPSGMAALRERSTRDAAAAGSDAETNARVAAQQAAAQEATTAEQQRLGAQQYLSGSQAGYATQLGQMGLGENRANEAQRLGATQDISNRQLQAATTGNQAVMQGLGTELGQANQNQQVGTQLENTAAGRAAGLAQNRQGVAQGVAGARLGSQYQGLGYLQGQQGQYNQNAQNAYNRQQQNYATQTGSANQAAGLGYAASQTPSTFDKVMGGISGGLGAIAGFLDEGGVATEPTVKVVGENGPEAIVPVGEDPISSTPGADAEANSARQSTPWWKRLQSGAGAASKATSPQQGQHWWQQLGDIGQSAAAIRNAATRPKYPSYMYQD